ncbi:MAG: 3',5'-cyclic adenosine monophosphate phosphodiesterase CpdA [Firmicutes bacterium]|nr:3',5'-cyclic adenosine monophosphate phosphodiesterase CpdA [Bacillota bacterium]
MLGIFPDDEALRWLKEDLDRNVDKPTMVFMHRMLLASWLMKELSRRYYCPEIVSPRAEEIVEILNNHGNVIATFSGHSHTNYSRKKGGILYISTAALIGPPYQFRVINVYKDRISTSVRTAHPLKKR